MFKVKQKISKVYKDFKPREFHCYCIGAAKTGTTSIASSFSKSYRSGHEPETKKTNRLIIDYLEGEVSVDTLKQKLRERDERLRLEVESAHPLGYVSGVLAEIFPHALFIVTLREPLSWLRSRLNYHYSANPSAWEEYRDYFWTQRHQKYEPEEIALQKWNLCSLDTYLSQYADHYNRVLSQVPESRRLLVLTSDINLRLPEIANFVGANPRKLLIAHSKRSDNKIDPLDSINKQFVDERIMHHCGDLISNFFPDKLRDYL
ncbi:sulfotransferase [Leptolyngbya iicbica]|uniref:Sulfotransferase n=2 Tax=Cyanophyceae TaxID=3028117 RepID=A0A4Q7E3N8_9CYAN|nr:sulfotransferase [Leptolyngbya sp. LK]RZM76531.1 hypothetical protein DYY88_17840 [Leptolyngbya sp. LK]